MLNPSLKDLGLSSEELKEIVKFLHEKEVLKAIKACLKIKTSKKSKKSIFLK